MISFKRPNQAAPVSPPAKHFSSTPIEVYAAVEAPREAPGNASDERCWGATKSFGSGVCHDPGTALIICTRKCRMRHAEIFLHRGLGNTVARWCFGRRVRLVNSIPTRGAIRNQ
jgi:hypothetical protein